MPYELVLLKFDNGEPAPVPTEPLIEALARHGIQEIGSEYHQTLDGLDIELPTHGLREESITDIAVSFRGISPGLFELIFDLAVLASMTVIVVDTPSIPLIFMPDAAEHLPAGDLGAPIICQNPSDVAAAILPGFNSWEDWDSSKP